MLTLVARSFLFCDLFAVGLLVPLLIHLLDLCFVGLIPGVWYTLLTRPLYLFFLLVALILLANYSILAESLYSATYFVVVGSEE